MYKINNFGDILKILLFLLQIHIVKITNFPQTFKIPNKRITEDDFFVELCFQGCLIFLACFPLHCIVVPIIT